MAVPGIPQEFAYIESSPGRDVTLWLVDLSGGTAPAPVARWTLGSGSFAASRDGKTVIIAAAGQRSITALHLLRPLAGEATILFEGPPDGRVYFPRLSPDGRSFAFTLQRELGSDGLWIGDVNGGPSRQLIAPTGPSPPVVPYVWSDEGQWLAYFAPSVSEAQGCCTYVQNVTDGRRLQPGGGHLLSWRAREPRLLAAVVGGKGNQGAFGATFYTFDLSQQRRTDILSIEPRVTGLAWHPTRDEFLYVQETKGCPYHGTLWVRPLGNDARRVGAFDTVQRAWWSADGSAIYALVRGEGQDAIVVEAASGRRIATIPNDVPARGCP